jgi:hypothetical protein
LSGAARIALTGRDLPRGEVHDRSAHALGDVADLAALAVVDGAPTRMPDRLRSDARNGW